MLNNTVDALRELHYNIRGPIALVRVATPTTLKYVRVPKTPAAGEAVSEGEEATVKSDNYVTKDVVDDSKNVASDTGETPVGTKEMLVGTNGTTESIKEAIMAEAAGSNDVTEGARAVVGDTVAGPAQGMRGDNADAVVFDAATGLENTRTAVDSQWRSLQAFNSELCMDSMVLGERFAKRTHDAM